MAIIRTMGKHAREEGTRRGGSGSLQEGKRRGQHRILILMVAVLGKLSGKADHRTPMVCPTLKRGLKPARGQGRPPSGMGFRRAGKVPSTMASRMLPHQSRKYWMLCRVTSVENRISPA